MVLHSLVVVVFERELFLKQMGKFVVVHLLLLVLHLGLLLPSLACPYCPYPTPPTKPPKVGPKPPPHVKPPHKPPHVKPPHVKPPPVKKPSPPKPPSPSPVVPLPPSPPKVVPIPSPPIVPSPPKVVPTPSPPKVTPTPPSPPPEQQTCSIDTLKLGACVDLLGGLINIGIGSGAKDTCCPVLQGLVDLDAALCLCTTIKAKLLNINIVLPIALQLLIACGKNPPPGYQCPT